MKEQTRQHMSAVGRRHEVQPVVEQNLTGSISVEERWPRVIEVETRIIAVELVQMFGSFNLQGIHRDIPVFVPNGNEEELAVGERQQEDDTKKYEESRSGEEAFHTNVKGISSVVQRRVARRKIDTLNAVRRQGSGAPSWCVAVPLLRAGLDTQLLDRKRKRKVGRRRFGAREFDAIIGLPY